MTAAVPSGGASGGGGAAGGGLTKAYLLFEGTAGATPAENKIDCKFNPESFTVTASNVWTSSAAAGAGVTTATFGGRNGGTLAFDLWFDTTKKGDPVTVLTEKLLKKMEIDKSLAGTDDNTRNGRPPRVVFGWGSWRSWPAVITSATVVYDYFSSSGVALRAKVSLSMTEYTGDENTVTMQNPTSGTPEPHRVHRVQRGETLDRISARYYGDSTRWRTLAVANGIEDPLGLRPGSLITIPKPSAG